MMRVWPADTDTGGISFLAADFGSGGALTGPEGLEAPVSMQSRVMENWTRERFGFKSRTNLLTLRMSFFCPLIQTYQAQNPV